MSTESSNYRILSAVLIALLILASFISNMFLMATILASSSLRSYKFYVIISILAFINILDTSFNIFISLLYVARASWTFGNGVCTFNSSMNILLSFVTLACIAILSVDRAVVLLSTLRYAVRMSWTRVTTMIALSFSAGTCLAFPIWINSVQSLDYPSRHFCSPCNTPLGFSIAEIVLYFIALIIILVAFSVILYRAHEERVVKRTALGGRTLDYTNYIVANRMFLFNLGLGKFCVTTFIFYMLMHGPYFIMKSIQQILNSRELAVFDECRSLFTDSHTNLFRVPVVAETAITWLKFLFPVTFPFIVFGYCKEIWVKFKGLVCCTTNAVAADHDLSRKTQGLPYDKNDDKVLTLVATTDGLHFRSSHTDEDGNQREEYAFADIMPHRSRGQGLENTSDYDSEDSDSFDVANTHHAAVDEMGHRKSPSRGTVASGSQVRIESAPHGRKSTTPKIVHFADRDNNMSSSPDELVLGDQHTTEQCTTNDHTTTNGYTPTTGPGHTPTTSTGHATAEHNISQSELITEGVTNASNPKEQPPDPLQYQNFLADSPSSYQLIERSLEVNNLGAGNLLFHDPPCIEEYAVGLGTPLPDHLRNNSKKRKNFNIY